MPELRYDQFRVIREISKGGMAQVYLARDEETDKDVALKVLLPHVADDQEFRLRFGHEVQAHRSLVHPNIVQLFASGEHEGRPYIAMEYVDGPTLKRLLLDAKRLPPEVAIYVVAEVLTGLAHAHASGVVHRDVKPSNIMLSQDGKVKIADFGIAMVESFTKLTQTGAIIGTPAYMSPEQARGEHADKRSDLFAMGVILYEALVGANPFQADHPATTLRKVIDADQTPLFEINPSIPAELEAVVDNLMEKSIVRRYQDAPDVLRDLETVRSARSLPFDAVQMTALVADARVEAARREKAAAEAHFQKGIELYREGRGSPERAIWEIYQAVVIDPSHAQARSSLEIIAQERGYRLQASDSPEIRKLREKIEKEPANPANPGLLVQLAKLYKKEGNFLQVIRCYVRLKKLQSRDPYLNSQMNTLIGVENLDAFDRTRSLVARRPAADATGLLDAGSAAPGPAVANMGRVKLPPRPFEEAPVGQSFLKSVLTPPVILSLGAVIAVGLLVRTLVGGEKKEEMVRPGELAADLQQTMEGLDSGPSGPDDEATALLRRAMDLVSSQPSRAQEMSQRFLDKFGDHENAGRAHLTLARALEAQGKRDEAIAATNQGIAKMQGGVLVETRRFRARVMTAMGGIDDAVHEYQAIEAGNDPEAAPAAKMDAVRLLAKSARSQEALQMVTDLLGFYPKWRGATDAKLMKAQLLLGLSRGTEALPLLAEIQKGSSIDSPEYKAAENLKAAVAKAEAGDTAAAAPDGLPEGAALPPGGEAEAGAEASAAPPE